jgi:hypothetical protein
VPKVDGDLGRLNAFPLLAAVPRKIALIEHFPTQAGAPVHQRRSAG